MRTRFPLAVGALLTALALASCAPAATPEKTPAPTSEAPSPMPSAALTPAESDAPKPEAGADPTCETLISPATVEALTAQGWTSMQEEFWIGETIVDGGLMCMWADFSTASDHGQMYAWGTLTAETADAAMAGLQRDGWLRSQDGDRIYFTEDPAYAIATDSNGFGMTYEFGDGWVKFADTKQGLVLIDPAG